MFVINRTERAVDGGLVGGVCIEWASVMWVIVDSTIIIIHQSDRGSE